MSVQPPTPSTQPSASAASDPALITHHSSLVSHHSLLGVRLRDWAELIRLPNIFTAMADPLAGALIMGAGLHDIGQILVVMLASACSYAGGIALNDWHDYRRDLVERPQRPLPSKRIPRWRALAAAVLLLSFGQILASALDPAVAGICLLLLVVILLYDVLMKDIPVAPALLGVARALNLLMGMSIMTAPAGAPRFYPAIALALYVTGITVFARREAGPSRKEQLLVGAGFIATGLLMLALLWLFFLEKVVIAAGELWVTLLSAAMAFTLIQAIRTPAPVRIQRAVKVGILGIILFDAALVAFCRGLPLSLLVVILLIPAVWLGRWLYST
jgi:4-hydroxybenzoate polyprenyltransferase